MDIENGTPEAASSMAFRLWRAEHGVNPKASDRAEFLKLVSECFDALRGRAPGTGYNMAALS